MVLRYSYILALISCILVQVALLGTKYFIVAPVVPLAAAAVYLIYRYPEMGILLFVFTVPFEGLFEGNKFFTGAKLIGVLLIAVTAVKVVLREVSLKNLRTPVLIPISSLLLVCFVSGMFSEYPGLATPFIKRLMTVVVVGGLVLIWGDRINLVSLARTISLSIAMTGIMSLLFSPHNAEDAERAVGMLSDPNFFALLLICALPLVVYLILHEDSVLLRLFWGLLCLAMLAAFMKTMSRSGLLILVATFSLLGFHYRYLLKKISLTGVIFVGLAMVLGLVTTVSLLPSEYQERIMSLSALSAGASGTQDPSLSRRSSYILIAWQIFTEHPLLGSGPGTFPLHYAQSGYASTFYYSSEVDQLYRQAHNTYLELIAETGQSGLLSFFGIIAVGYWEYWRMRQRLLADGYTKQVHMITHLGATFVAITMFFMFLSVLTNKYFWIYLCLGCSLPQLFLVKKTPTGCIKAGMENAALPSDITIGAGDCSST